MNDVMVRLEFDKILERVSAKASFSLGKKRILESSVSYSMLVVNRDLKRLKDAMEMLQTQAPFSFGGITDVSASLSRSGKGAVLAIDELIAVGRFIQGSDRLKKHYLGLDVRYDSLDDLFDSLVLHPDVSHSINNAFGDNGEVLDRASKALMEIRQKIKGVRHNIDSRTQEFLSKNRDALVESVVTLHHGRQTFLLKPGDKNRFEGSVLGSSSSGQSVYFEPAFLTRLQSELNSLLHMEMEEIDRICAVISMDVGKVSLQLEANLQTCAMLDALFAKAIWGHEHNGVVSTITVDSLYIENARHPLIDPKEVVANTYSLSAPHKMILISGPNTGGKSVTLKTMGLFVMMSLAGFPVLADKSEVMMVDQIFVDIGDQQSIERSLSSFSAHLETIKHVTSEASSKSLVLLDELGSQTDPLEGEALSMAILDYFRELGCWVVATTHFSGLKKYGTQYDDILIASVEFDMKNLKPTYKYKEHVLGESNALAIASRLGIFKEIIDKAEAYKKESTFEADNLLEILGQRIKENDALQESLIEDNRKLQDEKVKQEVAYAALVKSLQDEKVAWIQEKDLEFTEKLEALEAKIRSLNSESKPTARHKILKEVESMRPEVVVEPIELGDRVRINKSSQVGIVDKIERDIAFVSVGAMSLQVKVKDVTKIHGAPDPKKQKKARTHRVDKAVFVPMECNVIGLRVADALPLVSKHIDDCVLARMGTCRIVHGVGTGKLRSAVHDLLRKHKMVESFELASVSEGGAGATRVVLKQ
jgi:DNA mismatch repair protein MutS2